jgi:nitrite reductase/ring-hydroxylating ferredoxin subunit
LLSVRPATERTLLMIFSGLQCAELFVRRSGLSHALSSACPHSNAPIVIGLWRVGAGR